jgi:sugar (pentulose or hexulose) kinase
MTLALGIDIGTSGVRTAVLSADGTVVSMAKAAHLPQDAARIDATLWWDAVVLCLRKQLGKLDDPGEITAIAVDGTSGSMVLTDQALNPVTRALMYNSGGFDAEAAAIARVAPDRHITRGTSSALARAMRLMGEDRAKEAHHLLHQADFIAARLAGRGGWSDDNNALKTGFDPEARAWPDWFASLDIPMELLPGVEPPGGAMAPVAPEVAEDLGLSKAVMIHLGTTDSIAAFLASADPLPGAAVTSLGTTLAIKIMSPQRIDDPEIGLYSHRLGDAWLVGGASNTGGGVLAEHFSADQLAKLSERINPNAPSGYDYYPLRSPGERFPINDPGLPPMLTPRPQDDAAFLHGMLEGMARIEAMAYRAIEERGGVFPKRILTAGGGAQNPVWTAIRQRIIGAEVVPAPRSEAAIGAARLPLSGV